MERMPLAFAESWMLAVALSGPAAADAPAEAGVAEPGVEEERVAAPEQEQGQEQQQQQEQEPEPEPEPEPETNPTAPATEPPVEEAPPPAPGLREHSTTLPDETTTQIEPKPPDTKPKRPKHPRLTLTAGPLIGPHAIGNEECREEEGACETTGGFFGTGVQTELRFGLYKILYGHARALIVGNATPNSRVYRGLWGLGAGIGAYGRYAFIRGEYLFVDAFGDNTFAAPFATSEAGRDEWGHHAGLISAGFRKDIKQKLGIELWGGPMIGPRSNRTFVDLEADRRILITFMVSLALSYDIVQ